MSTQSLALYVDCTLIESVNWTYTGMDIATDGLLLVGGLIEDFETPFEVRAAAEMEWTRKYTQSVNQFLFFEWFPNVSRPGVVTAVLFES